MQLYDVICRQCRAVRQVAILKGKHNDVVDWLDNNPDPQLVKIVSARKRFDNQWGWQCICGNDDLWTDQEKKFVKNRVSPQPKEIASVINSLKPQPSKFKMVAV